SALAAARHGLPWAPANDASPPAGAPLQTDLPMPIAQIEAPEPTGELAVLPTLDLPPRDQLELALRSLDESARLSTEPGLIIIDDEEFERAKTERGFADEPPFERAKTNREESELRPLPPR